MAGAMAGRRGASGLWPGEGLALAGGSRTHGRTRGRVRARRRRHVREGEGTCVGARLATMEGWELVGVVGVATTGEAPRWLAREQARELDDDRALALPRWKAYSGGDTSVHGERDAGELSSGRKTGKRGELALSGIRVCVRARVRGYEQRSVRRTPTSRPQRRPERWRRRGVWTNGHGRSKKGRRASCVRGRVGSDTCKR
jgi:hypothetical protein